MKLKNLSPGLAFAGLGFLLIVLSIVLLSFHLGTRPFLSTGEARAAEIAVEMMARNNYLIPHLNEQILLTKPPLFHWLIILSYNCFGIDEFSSRFLSFIAGVLVVILVYLLGRKLTPRIPMAPSSRGTGPNPNQNPNQIGFIAGLILLTSPLYFWSMRCGRIDAILLFFITASFYCFWQGYERLSPRGLGRTVSGAQRSNACGAKEERYRLPPDCETHRGTAKEETYRLPQGRYWFWGWFFFMGLGFLSKGPIGAIGIVVVILFLLIVGERKKLKHLRWFSGIVIFLAIVLPWYISIYYSVPAGKSGLFFLQQNKAWLVSSGEWLKCYIYIFHLLICFFPWSLFIPLALVSGWRQFKVNKDPKIIFLWLWVFTIFIIFSFTGKKVSRYILPLYPAIAILTAQVIARCRQSRVFILIQSIFILLWALVLIGVNYFDFVIKYWPGKLDPLLVGIIRDQLVDDRLFINLAGVVLILFALIGLKKFRFLITLMIMIATLFSFVLFGIPVESAYYSPEPFCDLLIEKVGVNDLIYAYKSWDNTIRYYSGRHVDILNTEEELDRVLNLPQQVYCIMWTDVYHNLDRPELEIVAKGYRVMENDVVLVSNQRVE